MTARYPGTFCRLFFVRAEAGVLASFLSIWAVSSDIWPCTHSHHQCWRIACSLGRRSPAPYIRLYTHAIHDVLTLCFKKLYLLCASVNTARDVLYCDRQCQTFCSVVRILSQGHACMFTKSGKCHRNFYIKIKLENKNYHNNNNNNNNSIKFNKIIQ